MTQYTLNYSEFAEKEIEMKQNEVYGINTRPLRRVQRIRMDQFTH